MRFALTKTAHPIQVDLHRQKLEVVKLRNMVRLAIEIVCEFVNYRVDHLWPQQQHRIQCVKSAYHAELEEVGSLNQVVHYVVEVNAIAGNLSNGICRHH